MNKSPYKRRFSQIPPLQEADTTFSELLQELPPDLESLAREFRAFTRARVIKSPTQLLRLVFLYCGLDESLRTVSANCAELGQVLTDQAVHHRLIACGPWLTALLRQMLPAPPEGIQFGKRLIVIDGSVVQAPGAKTSDYRIHLGWDWFSHQIVFLEVTTTKTGESLARFEWQGGDIALAAKILWLSLKLAWRNGVHALYEVWVGFKMGFMAVWDSITGFMTETWNAVIGAIARSIAWVINSAQSIGEAVANKHCHRLSS